VSLWSAAGLGAVAVVLLIVVSLAFLGRWLAIRNPTPLEIERDERKAEEPEDTLIPEAEALHNAPSGAAPGVTVRTVRKKAKKKAKAPAKPRRTPKTRRTRFERIDDD
jgi:hypothetical protein